MRVLSFNVDPVYVAPESRQDFSLNTEILLDDEYTL